MLVILLPVADEDIVRITFDYACHKQYINSPDLEPGIHSHVTNLDL
jgi:hypothetical protein